MNDCLLTPLTGPHHCRCRRSKHHRRIPDNCRYRLVLSCIVRSILPDFKTSALTLLQRHDPQRLCLLVSPQSPSTTPTNLPSFGQIYTLFSIKAVFLIGIATFELGSLICTLAPSSAIFILGRAVRGLGRGAINGGLFKLLRQCFPLSKQAITNSFFGSIQSVGLITAPTIGGALIDAFSWRACFGVNLPLGVMCLVLTAYGVHEQPPRNDAPVLTLKEKVKKVDFFGTLLAVPAITFLLMALQWGGTKFGWGSWQIILPLVVCALLFVAFGYLQYRQGDNALLPPRILKQRSIIAGMWYGACCEGVLAVTEYYMSIYFQGVRGYTPTKAGLLALPMVGGLAIAFIISGVGTTWIGYYYRKYPSRPLNLN